MEYFGLLSLGKIRLDCIANHHFGTVTLCLQKISNSKTNLSDEGTAQDLMAVFFAIWLSEMTPSAITKKSTEHEIDNFSITAEWILMFLALSGFKIQLKRP